MFVRRELIGDTKINVTPQPANVLTLAREIADAKTLKGSDESFMLVNLDALYDRFKLWKRELPMIEPFYAMKTNSDETILRCLASLGVGFDCASKEEMDTVTRIGVSPDCIIYANPCKSSSFIVHAEEKAVNLMTFDSVDEMEKIASHHNCPELILRFAVSDPTANNPMSGKFGADPMKEAPLLLRHASIVGLRVVGVSFHVGSGCNDPTIFRVAIQYARNLFNIGLQLGHKMEIVDIGGGFPGGKLFTSFEKTASVIRSAINEFFPDPTVRIIAEPGRFFAARPCTLVANVIARKTVLASSIDGTSTRMHYYINDGVYGSFNLVLFGEKTPIGRPLLSNIMMRKLDIGEWMVYEEMGAYTTAASTTFNGFPRPTPIYVISEQTWKDLSMHCNNNSDV